MATSESLTRDEERDRAVGGWLGGRCVVGRSSGRSGCCSFMFQTKFIVALHSQILHMSLESKLL